MRNFWHNKEAPFFIPLSEIGGTYQPWSNGLERGTIANKESADKLDRESK